MSSKQNSRRTTLWNSEVNADDDLDFCFICKKEDHGQDSDIIDWITCDGCEEWFDAVCAKVSFSAGSGTAAYTCKDCTRANRHTAELKSFITESISSSIAEVRNEFLEFRKWTKSEMDGLTNNNMTLFSNEVDTQRAKIKSIVQSACRLLLFSECLSGAIRIILSQLSKLETWLESNVTTLIVAGGRGLAIGQKCHCYTANLLT
jgi:hypothetical protein